MYSTIQSQYYNPHHQLRSVRHPWDVHRHLKICEAGASEGLQVSVKISKYLQKYTMIFGVTKKCSDSYKDVQEAVRATFIWS
jgi:hypothetical protein